MKRWAIWSSLAVLLLVTLGPAALRVDGLVPTPARGAPDWDRLATPGAALALLFALAQLSAFSAAWRGRLTSRKYVAIAWLLAAGMTLSLTAAGDARGFTLAKSVSFQGYADDGARFDGPRALLADYNTRHGELSPHSATHPPGPVLLYQGLSGLAHALTARWPSDLGFSNHKVLGLAVERNLIGGVVVGLAWLWLWPLAGLTRLLGDRRSALVAVALAAALPCIQVIAPMPDILHPLLATSAAFVAALAARSERFGLGVIAGILAVLLALFSFGNLVAFPLLAAVMLLAHRGRKSRALALPIAGVLAGLLAAYAGLHALGYDFFAGLSLSLEHHAAGVNASRGYLAFLFSSPYTFLLWLGPPIVIGAARSLRASPARWLAWTTLALLAALTLTGTSRGETERLWLSLAPFLVLLAALELSKSDQRAPLDSIACMLALCLLFEALTGQYA